MESEASSSSSINLNDGTDPFCKLKLTIDVLERIGPSSLNIEEDTSSAVIATIEVQNILD